MAIELQIRKIEMDMDDPQLDEIDRAIEDIKKVQEHNKSQLDILEVFKRAKIKEKDDVN